MQTSFFGRRMLAKNFFLDMNTSGMSPWHILVAEGMMCNRPWVIAIDSWRVGKSNR